MSIQVICDDCGVIDAGYERIDDVIKPASWREWPRKYGKRTSWVDLCGDCYAKALKEKEESEQAADLPK